MVPLYFAIAYLWLKKSECFTDFRGSSGDTHQQSCRVWPKERAPARKGVETGPCHIKRCQTCGLSLGPGSAKNEQTSQVKEEQKIMSNDTKLAQVYFRFFKV